MLSLPVKLDLKAPAFWFVIGWCLILLVPIPPIMPQVQTFIHPWRPELTASLLFLITLIYLLYRCWGKAQSLDLSRPEINFIILPLLAFIAWSGLSIAWSPSWKSALYHTLVWVEYLIFYVLLRQLLNKRSGLKAFLIPLTGTLLIIALPPVFEYFAYLFFGGATSLGMRYAKYGELFNTVGPLIILAALRLRGKHFALGLSVVLVFWLFIISTLGRTNLIIFLSGLALLAGSVFLFKRFHKYRKKMALIVAAVVLVPLPFHSISFFAEEPSIPLVQRMNDAHHISYSTDVRKLLNSVSFEMFKANPITGVGADNFGLQFNGYRAGYAAKNPADVNLMTAEAEIVERAHNEYLQILAELGAVGGLIFLWFLSGVALMIRSALKRPSRISLLQIAVLSGVCFFLASSTISSYSFRVVQNGFVFFFVLAVAAKFIFALNPEEKTSTRIHIAPGYLKLGYAAGIAACLLLTVHCLVRATSIYYAVKAQSQTDIDRAMPDYRTAFWLDEENPGAHAACGINLFNAGRYGEAAAHFRRTIESQRATSIEFSFLASAQTLAGDHLGAEETIAEALRLYPLSTFLLTRHAALLKANGKIEESHKQLQTALRINKREANTWWIVMNEGARKASLRAAAEDDDFEKIGFLKPGLAIYAVVAEREIRYPEEKFNIPMLND